MAALFLPQCPDVHTDLIKNGQLPADIYWRDTAKQVQWIENEDWVYTRDFTVDAQSVARIPFDCKLEQNEIIICDLQNENVHDRCFYKEGKPEMVNTDGVHIVEQTRTSVTVEAEAYVHAVALEGNGVFSDSYFSLLPGQRRTVSFIPTQGAKPGITCLGYTLV